MARALLFVLFGKADAGLAHACPHLLRLMAHHRHYLFRRRYVESRANDVVQQSIATGLVQNFCFLRFHACSKPSCQNHDGYIVFHFDRKRCAASASLRT
jgi:hypothetical protein